MPREAATSPRERRSRQIPINPEPAPASRGFFPWRLSDAGPNRPAREDPSQSKGPHPKPFTFARARGGPESGLQCGAKLTFDPECRLYAGLRAFKRSGLSAYIRHVHGHRLYSTGIHSLKPKRRIEFGRHVSERRDYDRCAALAAAGGFFRSSHALRTVPIGQNIRR